MTPHPHAIYKCILALSLCLVQVAGGGLFGQDRPKAALKRSHLSLQAADTVHLAPSPQQTPGDSLKTALRLPADALPTADSLAAVVDSAAVADSIATENKRRLLQLTASPEMREDPVPVDTLQKAIDTKHWIPNPTKATWLALVIPGGGQIYNRKFWKLPIFYGGFAGCAYALTWNSKMYNDYSDAYRDAVNNNWNSSSITDLLPPGYTGSISHSQLTETLRRRKDTYRRYRDLSIFAFIGVYLLSVVDAYVDAELSNFDITPDLSMKVEPAVIDNNDHRSSCSPLTRGKSVGLQCSFRF